MQTSCLGGHGPPHSIVKVRLLEQIFVHHTMLHVHCNVLTMCGIFYSHRDAV